MEHLFNCASLGCYTKWYLKNVRCLQPWEMWDLGVTCQADGGDCVNFLRRFFDLTTDIYDCKSPNFVGQEILEARWKQFFSSSFQNRGLRTNEHFEVLFWGKFGEKCSTFLWKNEAIPLWEPVWQNHDCAPPNFIGDHWWEFHPREVFSQIVPYLRLREYGRNLPRNVLGGKFMTC